MYWFSFVSVYNYIVERCSNLKFSYKYVIVVLTDIKKVLCEILILYIYDVSGHCSRIKYKSPFWF